MSEYTKIEFQYPIERYLDSSNNLIISSDSEDESSLTFKEVILKVVGRSYYRPAKTNCLPEDSYPEESDVEVLSIIGPNNEDWSEKISETEREYIMSNLSSNDNADYPDTDDYHDDDYDDSYEDDF